MDEPLDSAGPLLLEPDVDGDDVLPGEDVPPLVSGSAALAPVVPDPLDSLASTGLDPPSPHAAAADNTPNIQTNR